MDESLALGVLGEHGRGACEHWGLRPGDAEIVSASIGAQQTIPFTFHFQPHGAIPVGQCNTLTDCANSWQHSLEGCSVGPKDDMHCWLCMRMSMHTVLTIVIYSWLFATDVAICLCNCVAYILNQLILSDLKR